MLERVPTAYDDRIYGAEWRAWTDPVVAEEFAPTTLLLDRHCDRPAKDKPAVIIDGEPASYATLTKLVADMAAGLHAIGAAPEDRMLLFGTDSLDYVALWLAAVRAGIVPAVVSDLYKAGDLLYFLRDTAARLLFIDAEQSGKLLAIAGALPPSLRIVILRGAAPPEAASALAGRTVVPIERINQSGLPPLPPCPRHRHDVAYMFFSGGTTGTAKGITHLAHDFILVPERHGRFWEYRSDDVVFATSKKYFTHGLWPGLLIPLYWGATAVLIRGSPSPDAVLATLEAARVTKFITVPTVLKNMLAHIAQAGIAPHVPALEFVASASEKMPPEIFARFHRQFGIELFDSIGSSEITYEWIANRQREFRRGSLGKPVFGCEVRLVAAGGHDVTEPNVPGEAWIRSRTACFFYWRKYDKSRETFVGAWTRTGDNLYFDEDGFFWFAGRDDDMFKVGGLWVAPLEIEAALTAHPAVREAAVVPFANGDGLTRPMAYVVLHQHRAPSDTLIAELGAAVRVLGGYKVPERYTFIDALPRTTLLKIDRRALRSLGK